MNPQPVCSLPWCGKSFPAEPSHTRVFRVKGRMVTLRYPAGIQMHDVVHRSHGGDPFDLDNQIPLCLECHDRHHGGKRLELFGVGHGRYEVLDGLKRRPLFDHKPEMDSI